MVGLGARSSLCEVGLFFCETRSLNELSRHLVSAAEQKFPGRGGEHKRVGRAREKQNMTNVNLGMYYISRIDSFGPS